LQRTGAVVLESNLAVSVRVVAETAQCQLKRLKKNPGIIHACIKAASSQQTSTCIFADSTHLSKDT